MPTPVAPQIQFRTFFQAFWLGPAPNDRDRKIGFHGTASAFSVVLREVSTGRPVACYRPELVAGAVVLDLRNWMTTGVSVAMYLFGDHADATAYNAQSAGGWTEAELQIIRDPTLLNMIPDVSFDPQNRVRAARAACDPRDPQSVAIMNADLLVNYQRFTAFDGHVLPEVAAPGIKGVLIAAPGNPPQWIPP